MLNAHSIWKRELGFSKWAGSVKDRDNRRKERFIGIPGEQPANDEHIFALQKEKNRDFVILNITDTHFADYDARALMAAAESHTIRRLVKSVKPDLITVTGDLICSDCAIYSMKRICNLFESFGIPWAPVFGNHEDESNMDKNYMADLFLSCPHCIFYKNDPAMGVGNYIINVCEGDRIVESVFMMDSHHGQPNEIQQEWFRYNAEKINEQSNNAAEIMLMFHIPLPEYQYAFDAAWCASDKRWRKEYAACGERNEDICCEKRDGVPVQRGFFEILQNTETVKHVFCGHEHVNDFSILYKGIRLTYTMKVGRASGGGYGLNGGTVIGIGAHGVNQIQHKTINFGLLRNRENIVVE